MAKIEDFEKRYVSTVVFNEGDKILVTEENIDDLRQALKNTNFHWMSGHQIVDGKSFRSNRVFHLYEQCSSYTPVSGVKPEKNDGIKAINYVFVDY